MPNYYNLTKKGQTTPSNANQIDEEICLFLGVQPHPKYYRKGWNDFIGQPLAYGMSFDKIISDFEKQNDPFFEELIKIAKFLQENYTPDAWATIGGNR